MAYHQELGAAIIAPDNGQLDAVPGTIYRVMFALFGIRHTGRIVSSASCASSV